MLSCHFLACCLSLFLVAPAYVQASFRLLKSYQGDDFMSTVDWNWETGDDPTHGRVNYLGLQDALQRNLTYTNTATSSFIMRADSTNTVPPTARGRDSIRISSTLPVDEGLFVLDLLHMPEGCGTWPAFWTLSRNGPWPKGGEIDIIEGVNVDGASLCSLHTTSGCVMPQQRDQTGTVVTTNCDAAINFNQGCGNRITTPGSFGSQFNKNDGGWYVMLKSRTVGIKIWFFPRNGLNVPAVIRYGAPLLLNINPNIGSAGINIGSGGVGGPDWGTPSVHFPPDMCPMADYFDEHVVVFDLTFCGDWAGSAWASSPCRTDACPTCESFVNENPSAFANAYWEILGLKVYKLA